MKFWELMSVVHPNVKIVYTVASTSQEWQFILDWLNRYDILVDIQDRAKLDYELPNQFTREVLKLCDRLYYLSEDRIWLRSWLASSTDQTLTALDTFDRYGGQAMDEAIEYGSFRVDPHE